MYYDTQAMQDENINLILNFLFQFHQTKNISLNQVIQIFESLDIASTYLLFSYIHDYLPRKAKLQFAGENYQGKKQMIIEVMYCLR